MVPASEVLRRLRQRHRAWMRERYTSTAPGRPDFLNGVLRGLNEAVAIARECHEASRKGCKRPNWFAKEKG